MGVTSMLQKSKGHSFTNGNIGHLFLYESGIFELFLITAVTSKHTGSTNYYSWC